MALISSLENEELLWQYFFDFLKAFDTVVHFILLTKLDYYGIRGNALVWFRSYITVREEFVIYNVMCSISTKPISCGVLQGSILGHLLILILIDIYDLCSVCKSMIPISFAVDINLFQSSQYLSYTESVLNELLRKHI